MIRTPAELALAVRDWISGPRREVDALPALAALAELEAQAEAGQRAMSSLEYAERQLSNTHARVCDALAAAAPSPADQRTPTYAEEQLAEIARREASPADQEEA